MITCEVCNGQFELKDIKQHHVSYFPEKVINVCFRCHGLIHRAKKAKPNKTETSLYYDIKNGIQRTLTKRKNKKYVPNGIWRKPIKAT